MLECVEREQERIGQDLHDGLCQLLAGIKFKVASLGAKEGMITYTADLDAEVLRSRTESFYGLTLLQDRRPELYRAISATS